MRVSKPRFAAEMCPMVVAESACGAPPRAAAPSPRAGGAWGASAREFANIFSSVSAAQETVDVPSRMDV